MKFSDNEREQERLQNEKPRLQRGLPKILTDQHACKLLLLVLMCNTLLIMINIDTRLIDPDQPNRLDADETYLAIHITKRINKERSCFPSNKTLCRDTGWGIEKVQAVKKRLESKAVINVKKGGGRFANLYTVNSEYLGNYLGGKITPGGNPDMLNTGESDMQNVGESGMQQGGESDNQVLTIDPLRIEDVKQQELRRRRLYKISCVFEDFVKTFWKDLEDYRHYYIHHMKEDEYYKTIPEATEDLLKKICTAAEKTFDAFEDIIESGKRERFRYQTDTVDSPGGYATPKFTVYRKGEIDSVFDEVNLQVNAYYDYCRLSGWEATGDPEKIPGKLLQGDWAKRLFDFIKPKIDKEEYDPAVDAEGLLSEWLIYLYYWQPMDIYECKRYNNRVVFDGKVYLHKG
jgi:hypothetical protein